MQGFVLRNAPSPYLAALALAAGPNLVGHILGPLAAAIGFWWVNFKGGDNSHDQDVVALKPAK